MAAAEDQDTEWNDILREKGILPQKPKELELTEDDILAMVDQAVSAKYHGKALEDRTLDELDELEDEEDERVLMAYRKQRLAEMAAYTKTAKYGSVTQISKPDWPTEVTEACKTVPVIIHLFQTHVMASRVLAAKLDTIARKYPASKFLKIVADACIENYPDRNVPTLLIYADGDLKRQLVGIEMMGGSNGTLRELEMILAASKSFELMDDEDVGRNDDEDENKNLRSGVKQLTGDDDDLDWD
ncbi:hypothetical protein SmJEL517_g02158 [Synchytrium microbalum]|uniref:Phosducin domain-containing protein n=1 Tax=Synchytrium microbalum TaxID=1806994 RepID=A0A507CD41_9FUNG|nr:uncharacterized protein SmJEL517_g02158 [Synchytrium microbalum]TPX35475.1 hypothetical protein SmJEL517_g02158 [Synchytrium microbalum]